MKKLIKKIEPSWETTRLWLKKKMSPLQAGVNGLKCVYPSF